MGDPNFPVAFHAKVEFIEVHPAKACAHSIYSLGNSPELVNLYSSMVPGASSYGVYQINVVSGAKMESPFKSRSTLTMRIPTVYTYTIKIRSIIYMNYSIYNPAKLVYLLIIL